MEKALEMMNVKLHTVISDLTGKTGSAIVRAILEGERDAKKFLPLVDGRIKASAETIEKSLQGHWREDQLFLLGEHYKSYQYFQSRIASCDRAIEEQLKQYAAMRQEGELSGSDAKSESVTVIKKKNKNAPSFNVHSYMVLVYGVNILAIYGISEINALQILAEVGTDMSKWKSAKHFVSWLNLCPNNKISGGKVISSRLASKKPNAASQAFRMAANAIQRSDNWLGDYFRRMKAKGGNKYAIVATANKLATIFYRMVSEQVEFNPVDMTEYREKQKLAKIAYLERRLEALKQQTA
jgi:transposase